VDYRANYRSGWRNEYCSKYLMVISLSEIELLDKQYRLCLINSITGFKSANLIGTVNADGITNLAIFSSVIHLGSSPALMGFITRPVANSRHTYRNILASKVYTVNAITLNLIEKAHQTSARFPEGISEFDACGIRAEYVDGHAAPFVFESPVKFACTLVEDIEIKSNGTRMIVGKVEALIVDDSLVEEDGYLNLAKAGVVTISALDAYHPVAVGQRYAYAKPDLPIRKLS
jgi:flavin reductase (DIM6/NTAB) family NADH-FMN oxidoreductase RutF